MSGGRLARVRFARQPDDRFTEELLAASLFGLPRSSPQELRRRIFAQAYARVVATERKCLDNVWHFRKEERTERRRSAVAYALFGIGLATIIRQNYRSATPNYRWRSLTKKKKERKRKKKESRHETEWRQTKKRRKEDKHHTCTHPYAVLFVSTLATASVADVADATRAAGFHYAAASRPRIFM